MTINFSLKKRWDHYREYFLPVMILALMILLTLTFVEPKMAEIINIRKDVSSSTQKLNNLTAKAEALSSLDVSLLKTKYTTLEGALPSEKDIPGFLVEMQKITNEASVSVDKVELSAGSLATSSSQTTNVNQANMYSAAKLPDAVSAKITVTGTFNSLRQFLDKTNQARRLVNIMGINLGGNQAQKASGPISLELIFSIYYKPLPKTLGEISSPLPTPGSSDDSVYQKIANYPLYSTFANGGTISVPVGKTDLFH